MSDSSSSYDVASVTRTHSSLISQGFHNWLCVVQQGDTVKVETMIEVRIELFETSPFLLPTVCWPGLGYLKRSR